MGQEVVWLENDRSVHLGACKAMKNLGFVERITKHNNQFDQWIPEASNMEFIDNVAYRDADELYEKLQDVTTVIAESVYSGDSTQVLNRLLRVFHNYDPWNSRQISFY